MRANSEMKNGATVSDFQKSQDSPLKQFTESNEENGRNAGNSFGQKKNSNNSSFNQFPHGSNLKSPPDEMRQHSES